MKWQSVMIIIDSLWLAALLPVWIWTYTCIHRTGEDRMKALQSWRFRPVTWGAFAKAYEAVSFTQHLRARMLFRDPWKLYDPIVLDAIINPVSEIHGMAVITGEPEDRPPAMH